jgi:hypothetical protein
MADISKLEFLNEAQFKQYVYGSLNKLIKKLANWEK